MGGGASTAEQPAAPPVNLWEDGGVALHSAIRWNKVDEVKAQLTKNIGVLHASDPQNGNYAVHIAAQNGHYDLMVELLDFGADHSVANGTGQTPLHMAYSYGYFWVARLLVERGADPQAENSGGYPAVKGIDGDTEPLTALDALLDSTTDGQVAESMNMLKAMDEAGTLGELDKVKVVQGMMQMNKKHKDTKLWTSERKDAMRAVIMKMN